MSYRQTRHKEYNFRAFGILQADERAACSFIVRFKGGATLLVGKPADGITVSRDNTETATQATSVIVINSFFIM